MVRVLVTGAAGFLGGHLSSALRARGYTVFGLDVRPIVDENSVIANVEDLRIVEKVIAEREIDTLFHLAAVTQVSVASVYPLGAIETNVRGTLNVLEACRRQGVKRIICASSDKSYGDGPVPYREDQPIAPHGIYATSKACGDFLASAYAREYGLPVTVVRCGNLYGPGHVNWSTLIPGTICSFLNGERPVLRSDGAPKRDYLYVEDAVAGYLALAGSEHTGAWNFGTEKPSSAIDVVRLIGRLMKSSLTEDVRATSRGEIQEQWLECSKAKNLLGWHAMGLEEGLRRTIPWYEALKGGVRG